MQIFQDGLPLSAGTNLFLAMRPLFSDSDDDGAFLPAGVSGQRKTSSFNSHVITPPGNSLDASRRTMRSLFAQNNALGASTSPAFRYSDQSVLVQSIAASASSSIPLQVVRHALVQAYSGEEYRGTCVFALCVPNTREPPLTASPLLTLVDEGKRTLCRFPIGPDLQLSQSTTNSQFVSCYDPALGSHWQFMFSDRRDAADFVVSVQTLAFHIRNPSSSAAEFMSYETGSLHSVSSSPAVQPGTAAQFGLKLWLLQRVGATCYYTTGKVVEEVPSEAPCDVTVKGGQWMVGLEECAVGMRAGDVRLCILPPGHTAVPHGVEKLEVTPADTVVALLHCVSILTPTTTPRRTVQRGLRAALTPPPPPPVEPVAAASTTEDPTMVALLQRTLLQALANATFPSSGGATAADAHTSSTLDRIERATERVQVQLGNLYEKLDRMDVSTKLQENNLALERIMKKTVGQLPQNEIDVEDRTKDREALLASLEKYKGRFEEVNENYQRALEAMSRYAEKVHSLENDLRIQQDTLEARLSDLAERHRLDAVEWRVRHQAEVDRVGSEQYEAGKAAGTAEGRHLGKQELLRAEGSIGADTWREKCLQNEQEVVRCRSELQEAQGRYVRVRRGLEAEIDSLRLLCDRLGAQQTALEVHVPEESTEQQCKRVKRALNAVYTDVETQLTAGCGDVTHPISVADTLSVLVVAIKRVSTTFTQEIRTEAALRQNENGVLRKMRGERQRTPAVLAGAVDPALPLLLPAPDSLQEVYAGVQQDTTSLPELQRAPKEAVGPGDNNDGGPIAPTPCTPRMDAALSPVEDVELSAGPEYSVNMEATMPSEGRQTEEPRWATSRTAIPPSTPKETPQRTLFPVVAVDSPELGDQHSHLAHEEMAAPHRYAETPVLPNRQDYTEDFIEDETPRGRAAVVLSLPPTPSSGISNV